ncbi:uncharacterized protein TNCV_4296031 [Trichonephila clavipes]|nr:uncharacterized protein TNCV_4296031 [Trichonephila clavipes]
MVSSQEKRRDVRVDLLSAGYGLGSWIAMTGLWVELPVLVQRLPEGWALASQLALFLQASTSIFTFETTLLFSPSRSKAKTVHSSALFLVHRALGVKPPSAMCQVVTSPSKEKMMADFTHFFKNGTEFGISFQI